MSALPDTINKPRTLVETRAIELLGRGYNQEVVASAIGVTPGRISQILEDEGIRAEIAQLRSTHLSKTSQHDENIDTTEAAALALVSRTLTRVQSPMEAARIFSMLNQAKRRSRPSEDVPNTVNAHTTVNLTLPTQIVHRYQTNDSGQVIEVDGKPIVTLPSAKLEEVAKNAYPQINKPKATREALRASDPRSIQTASSGGQVTGPEDI